MGDHRLKDSRSFYKEGQRLFDEGKYRNAEEALRKALAIGQGLEDYGSKLLDIKYWLASALLHQKKEFDEAESYFREAMLDMQKTLDPDHHDILSGKHMLGSVLYEQRKYDAAEPYLCEAVVGRERALGPLELRTLTSKFMLGCNLFGQGKHSEAEKLVRETLSGHEKTLGKSHRETLICRHLLADILYRRRKYKEAEGFFRQIVLYQGTSPNVVIETKIARCVSKQQKSRSSDLDLPSESWIRRIFRQRHSSTPRVTTAASSPEEVAPISLPILSVDEQQKKGCLGQSAGGLDKFFDSQTTRTSYSDLDISTISTLLERSNPRWSKVPRTYVVLRAINCLHLLDDLIASGFSDYWFPTMERYLPSALRPSQASDFVRFQHLVLTPSLDLEKGSEGKHCYFDQDEVLPFAKQRILGRGGFGQVDEVVSHISYKRYARKRVLRKTILRSGQIEDLQLFVTEIETLKRLSHKHVVEFVGSYSDKKYLGLLMFPVAEMDLSVYLNRADVSSRLGELRTFFGCLVAGLDYLHKQHVRHKDIKPGNILVDRGNIMFTDFGLAREYTDTKGSVTTGMVNGMSPRYCAPEVASCEPRNTSSDIWSLGIVFLEMLVVLKGQTLTYMEEFFLTHGTQRPFARTNSGGLLELIDTLKTIGKASDNRAIQWINDMLKKQPNARPTASSLFVKMNDHGEGELGSNSFCGICCVPDHDSSDDFSD